MPGANPSLEPVTIPIESTSIPPQTLSPYTHMFERFRDDIDEHHDRRERIIKSSREITALSKKM